MVVARHKEVMIFFIHPLFGQMGEISHFWTKISQKPGIYSIRIDLRLHGLLVQILDFPLL